MAPVAIETLMSPATLVNRRRFLALTGAAAAWAYANGLSAREGATGKTLLSAPIELAGDWPSVPREAVMRVLARVRDVDLSGVRLLSDRQPEKLHVENHNAGPPAIWLHSDQPEMASIIVDVGPADWCKLAYQFGHELGHVLSNSWQFTATPAPPTQWLEEALVEAFSLRGLKLLAGSWETSPPFAGDAAFAASIRQYRAAQLETYKAGEAPDAAAWFHAHRAELELAQSVPPGPAIVAVLAVYEDRRRRGDPSCVDDLGALNRWPERTTVPVERYIQLWKQSCREIGAPGELPLRLEQLFRLS